MVKKKKDNLIKEYILLQSVGSGFAPKFDPMTELEAYNYVVENQEKLRKNGVELYVALLDCDNEPTPVDVVWNIEY